MLSGLRPAFVLLFHGEITVVVYGWGWTTPAEELHPPGKDSAILDDVAPPSSDTLVTVRFWGVYANCFSGEGWSRSGSSSENEFESEWQREREGRGGRDRLVLLASWHHVFMLCGGSVASGTACHGLKCPSGAAKNADAECIAFSLSRRCTSSDRNVK